MSRAAAVVIGKNEGARLLRCLASLDGEAAPVVYVDSGSTDGSVAAARAAGATVVELDMDMPFTAARARNAGLAALGRDAAPYVQLVDGDCEMVAGWIDRAADFLDAHPRAAAVAGRLRERASDNTFSRLADAEWNVPPGEGRAIGGIALVRRAALAEVGGFDAAIAEGEEPELSQRLEGAGWQVWRIEGEMARHDIAMTRLSQWWRRTARGGRAAAGAWRRNGSFGRETRSALLWGAVLPAVAIFSALLVTPWALLLLAAFPLQVLRLAIGKGMGWERAFFRTLGKLPEAQGVLSVLLRPVRG